MKTAGDSCTHSHCSRYCRPESGLHADIRPGEVRSREDQLDALEAKELLEVWTSRYEACGWALLDVERTPPYEYNLPEHWWLFTIERVGESDDRPATRSSA